MRKEEFIKITEKYIAKKATKKEEEVVTTFFDSLQSKKVEIEDDEALRLKMLTNIKKKTTQVKKRYRYYRIAAAASIFICLSVYLFSITQSDTIYYATLKGEKKNITLPDGSTVYLNSNSNVTYNKDFNNNRNIILNGEAFFKVTKDSLHPFIVKTSTIQTKVLGTSFNIKSHKSQDAIVTVNTGRVSVNLLNNSAKKLFLIKNQSAVYAQASKSLEKNEIISSNYSSWINNTFWINDLTMLEVAEKIERWFNVKVVIKDKSLEDLRLTGTYKNPKLEEVLESIKFLKRIDYSIKNDKVTIIKPKK